MKHGGLARSHGWLGGGFEALLEYISHESGICQRGKIGPSDSLMRRASALVSKPCAATGEGQKHVMSSSVVRSRGREGAVASRGSLA